MWVWVWEWVLVLGRMKEEEEEEEVTFWIGNFYEAFSFHYEICWS